MAIFEIKLLEKPCFSDYKVETKNYLFNKSANEALFYSNQPIIRNQNGYKHLNAEELIDFEEFNAIQNNIASFQFKDHSLRLISSRFTRTKWYYILFEDRIVFSTKLKQLIPYSNKTLNMAAALSVVKFGEAPDTMALVEGIQTVPASHYLELHLGESNPKLNLQQYYQIEYSFEERNINDTKQMLQNFCTLYKDKPVLMPVSGGIDSTLINHLINEIKENEYPAYFIQFGKEDSETEFAKRAVENTKADLHIFNFGKEDFISAFQSHIEKLDSPIGESSAIPLSAFFDSTNYVNKTILDGTLADGCYGSKNYNKPVFPYNTNAHPLKLEIAEYVSAKLILKNLPYQDKFFPRDSVIKDDFLRQMSVYTGPLPNQLFKNAKHLNSILEKEWLKLYNLISYDRTLDSRDIEWAKYSIFKMLGYASRVTTAKVEDVAQGNTVEYPFILMDILNDQSKYSWEDKTKNNIIKFPLKKILLDFESEAFVYRKKVGLNNSIPKLIQEREIQDFLLDIINSNKELLIAMVGKSNLKTIVKRFTQDPSNDFLNNFILTIASIAEWCRVNKVEPK